MKKLLLLSALFIFACSYGQKIVTKTYGKETKNKFGKTIKPKLISVDTINITQIKDEFISLRLGGNYHYLSTTNFMNIRLVGSKKFKKNGNVYDGDKLIPLYDESHILNFFDKYGFEYFKTSTYGSDIITNSYGNLSFSETSTYPTLIFKNKNN